MTSEPSIVTRQHPAAFVVSLDFELHWGVHDKRSVHEYESNLAGTRRAISATLDLFSEYGTRATWATVGLLFCNGRDEALRHNPELRPTYTSMAYSPYSLLESCGESETADPYHFAPSVIREIERFEGQEIGTHTYSHYLCLEEGQTAAQFEADLQAARSVARSMGIELTSLVFPRNQLHMAYVDIVRRAGVLAYRGNRDSWMYREDSASMASWLRRMLRLSDNYIEIIRRDGQPSVRDVGGLIDIPATRFLRPYSRRFGILNGLQLRRIKREMHVAANSGRVYHLWWHPHNFGVNLRENVENLREILEYQTALAKSHVFPSKNMGDIARTLLSGDEEGSNG